MNHARHRNRVGSEIDTPRSVRRDHDDHDARGPELVQKRRGSLLGSPKESIPSREGQKVYPQWTSPSLPLPINRVHCAEDTSATVSNEDSHLYETEAPVSFTLSTI